MQFFNLHYHLYGIANFIFKIESTICSETVPLFRRQSSPGGIARGANGFGAGNLENAQ